MSDARQFQDVKAGELFMFSGTSTVCEADGSGGYYERSGPYEGSWSASVLDPEIEVKVLATPTDADDDPEASP